MARLTLASDEILKFDSRINSVSDDGNYTKALGIIQNYKSLCENELSGFDAYSGYSQAFYDVMFKLGNGFDYFNTMTSDMESAESNQGLNLIKQLAGCASDLDTIYQMDLDRLKEQLAGLGGAMIIYAKGAESVNGGEITSDTDIGGAILLLQKISESLADAGGFIIPDNMPSDSDLTDFGIQLAALAGALVAFESAGSQLGDGTQKALEALDFFEDLKFRLSQSSNFGTDLSSAIQSFQDENGQMIHSDELIIFGEDIASLGSAMSYFAKSTQIVNEETGEIQPIDFSLATGALETLASLGNLLPDVGGIGEIILGKKKDLEDLAVDINLLGDAMKDFYTNTTSFNEANGTATAYDYSNSISFLTSLVSLCSELDTIKINGFNLESLFTKQGMTLADLSTQLEQLGVGLNDLSSKIAGTDENGNKNFDANAASEATRVLTDSIVPFMRTLATELPNVGGLGNIIGTIFSGRDANLGDVGTQIGALGTGLGEFGDGIAGKFQNVTDVDNAMKAIDSIVALMVHLSEATTMGFGYTSAADYAQDLSLFLSAFVNGSEYSELDTALNYVVQLMQMLSSMLDEAPDINIDNLKKFDLLASALGHLAGIDFRKNPNFENVGLSIAGGVALGIANGTSLVTEAAQAMAVEAYNAAMVALNAHSPSRVFMDVGSYIGLGMAKGIDTSASEVVDSATGMSEEVIDSVNDMVGIISRIMAEGVVDVSPTIAPVLDMTNLRNGMSEFGESLNGYSLHLDTALSSAIANHSGTPITSGVITPDYSGIYDRMAQLGQQISDMNRAISQMSLVLDTGVLVGALSDGIDEDFGRKSFYASRNN